MSLQAKLKEILEKELEENKKFSIGAVGQTYTYPAMDMPETINKSPEKSVEYMIGYIESILNTERGYSNYQAGEYFGKLVKLLKSYDN